MIRLIAGNFCNARSIGALRVLRSFVLLGGFLRHSFAATITYVQSNSATPQTSQTSVPVTFTAAQTAEISTWSLLGGTIPLLP